MQVIQSDFSGGMNLFADNVNLGPTQYGLAFNVRNRKTGLDTIARPVEDTTLPAGKKQGIYGFDVYLIAFVGGYAYYKNVVLDNAWTKINNFIMDPNVDYIYAQAVPASSINFKRSLITDGQILGSPQSIPLAFELINSNGSAGGLVVQDGINQPWFINTDGTADRLQTYAEWSLTNDAREYVPIMKQMAYANGILFGVAPDGKTLYRSVSGRPVDFVVNVTSTGDKGGDATTTSYSPGFNLITCLSTNANGDLIVGTTKSITTLQLNFDKTIFAEPTFSDVQEYSMGIVNQFSFVKYASIYHYLIDVDGLRTFTLGDPSQDNEGRNTLFTAIINPVLDGKQSITSAIIFDDYLIASVKTPYAETNQMAIYDNTRQVWVGIDSYPSDTIKQFAVADQSTSPVLYGISATKIYRFYQGERLESIVNLRGNTSGTGKTSIQLTDIYSVFLDGSLAGTINAMSVDDGIEGKIVQQLLSGLNTEKVRLNFLNQATQCWRTAPIISWQNDSRLSMVELAISEQNYATSIQQQVKNYLNNK